MTNVLVELNNCSIILGFEYLACADMIIFPNFILFLKLIILPYIFLNATV
jgi:hypothetical protein